ncbi:hypothetical protein DXG01_013164 [Tephrocybe rancida]|nr:hypothetical protein DXG01_013164 [Tephrocybe rancida]
MIPHLNRCHQFTLQCGRPAITRDGIIFHHFPFDLRLPTSLPLLREINLNLPFADAQKFLNLIFGVAQTPVLQRISLAGFPPSLLSYIPHSTLSRLTSLHTTSAESVQRCCSIFHLAPNLKRCRLDLHASDHVRKAVEKPLPITHHSLEQLYVGPTNLNLFFKSVTLPALQALSINGKTIMEWGADDDFWGPTVRCTAKWGQPAFLAFLSRSLCALTKLSFYDLDLTSTALIQCLEAVSPTLIELHIEGGEHLCVDQNVMNVLTYRRPGEPVGTLGSRFFCPRLERIRMRGYIFSFTGSGRAMVDMLESRYQQAWPVEGLSQLKWAFVGGRYLKNHWKRIEALESEGLELLVVEEGTKYLPNYLGDLTLFECKSHTSSPQSIISRAQFRIR